MIAFGYKARFGRHLPECFRAGSVLSCRALDNLTEEALALRSEAKALSWRPLVESLDLAEGWIRPGSLGFGGRLLPRCSVCGAAWFARRATVRSHDERRSKSARTLLLDTGRTDEESAADGLFEYLEERPRGRLVFP